MNILFSLSDGRVLEASADVGDSVMTAAVRERIPGIVGECGGEMSCATCHVKILDHDVFLSATQDEQDLLELADDADDDSRLGCQLKITDDTPDLSVIVPTA